MDFKLERKDLLRLVKGIVVPMGGIWHNGVELTKFCGNQWNEDWEFNEEVLSNLTDEELLKFYESRRG